MTFHWAPYYQRISPCTRRFCACGKVTLTAPSGEVAELEVNAGASMWMDATDHKTDNVGGTAMHALMFEPK